MQLPTDTASPAVLYATREEWMNAFLEAARPKFASVGAIIPYNTRISVGFTSAGHRGSVIGECWSDSASADGHFEIFIKPTTQTDARVAGIITHEAIHAALGIAEGHGKEFGRVARALGLTGKLTATAEGPEWMSWALPILGELGPMPYGALKGGMKPPRKKKKTYLIGHTCPECGTQAWLTAKNSSPLPFVRCVNPDCEGVMLPPEDDDAE